MQFHVEFQAWSTDDAIAAMKRRRVRGKVRRSFYVPRACVCVIQQETKQQRNFSVNGIKFFTGASTPFFHIFSFLFFFFTMLEPEPLTRGPAPQRRNPRPLSLIPDLDVPPLVPRW